MKQMTRFLIEEQRRHKDATGNFTALVNDIRLACKRIATLIGKGALADALGDVERQRARRDAKARRLANDIFIRTNEWGGQLAGMVSEEMDGALRDPGGVSARAAICCCSTHSTAPRT